VGYPYLIEKVGNFKNWRAISCAGCCGQPMARDSGTLMQCATLNVGTGFGPIHSAALTTRLLANNPKLSAPTPNRIPSKIAREDEPLLVKAAKSGDATAFEELVNRYESKIFRLTMNITRNREDAEDSMQDAFMKAYSHLDTFQEDSRFYTWLVRIAANEALMRLRKRRPNQVSLDEPVQGEDDLIPREVEDWGPSPEQRYAQSELHEILDQVIDQLDPDFRTVFVLRDIEELSTEETAQAMAISVPAVKSRLLRARLKLRTKLDRFLRDRKPN
jgi:RNA polymerase sigma-70 factor, ECF subfamily